MWLNSCIDIRCRALSGRWCYCLLIIHNKILKISHIQSLCVLTEKFRTITGNITDNRYFLSYEIRPSANFQKETELFVDTKRPTTLVKLMIIRATSDSIKKQSYRTMSNSPGNYPFLRLLLYSIWMIYIEYRKLQCKVYHYVYWNTPFNVISDYGLWNGR